MKSAAGRGGSPGAAGNGSAGGGTEIYMKSNVPIMCHCYFFNLGFMDG